MSTLGTIALSFAVPVYLLVLHALFSIPKAPAPERMISDATILATLAFAILWFLLAIALGAATAAGRFDWVAQARPMQYVITLSAHLATGFVTWLSILRRNHPAEAVPWSLRPIAPWATFVLPPVVLLGSLLALHPPLRSGLPQEWLHGAFTFTGIVSLVATACLLVELCSRRLRPPSA